MNKEESITAVRRSLDREEKRERREEEARGKSLCREVEEHFKGEKEHESLFSGSEAAYSPNCR